MSETDKKYKLTKQLLKLAIDTAGYRHKDIAVKAGLSKTSVAQVSAWRNGRKNATERQMAYFINEYGHLLKRKMWHLYYRYQLDGKKLVMNFVKLSGDIIFKHQIRLEPNPEYKKSVSALRVVIIENSGCYKLLLQYRAGLFSWKETSCDALYCIPSVSNKETNDYIVHSDNEEANWHLWKDKHCENIDELIEEFEKTCHAISSEGGILKELEFKGRRPLELCELKHIAPMKFSFYQKLMKLDLQSQLLPF
ncbi:hypothetical protein AB4278_23485 [Vibrio splendidus]